MQLLESTHEGIQAKVRKVLKIWQFDDWKNGTKRIIDYE